MAVLRFPNPVSDVPKFVDVFRLLHQYLITPNFGQDDIVKILIEQGQVSSCGTVGDDALARSTREDRSRDPLFNQAKMYSELFRMLGWIHPGTDQGHFVFSDIAPYIASERINSSLILESLYSIVFPNPHVETRSGNSIRPFAQILYMMRAMGGLLSRDELIISVLSLDDDRKPNAIENQVSEIKSIRGKLDRLLNRLTQTAEEAGIGQTNTLQNYTRFPLGVLRSTGWADSERVKGVYEKPHTMYRLTKEGNAFADDLMKKVDVRHAQLEAFDDAERAAFVLMSQYEQLRRAKFDVSAVLPYYPVLLKQCEPILKSIKQTSFDRILYSPFQQAPPLDIQLAKQLDASLGA
jgi:hypothetical protein